MVNVIKTGIKWKFSNIDDPAKLEEYQFKNIQTQASAQLYFFSSSSWNQLRQAIHLNWTSKSVLVYIVKHQLFPVILEKNLTLTQY